MWTLLATGFLGSLHCVGMCGGFVLALDRPGGAKASRVAYQALFHLGKTTTYVILGALVGLLGASVLHAPWFGAAQAFLAALAGLLMVLAGLQIMGLLKELPLGRLFGHGSAYDRAVKAVINLRGPTAPIALGSLTGLLPCPLVYAFLAAALEQGSLLRGMGVMAILGFASMPALALVVLTGSMVRPHVRMRLIRVAGVVVVVLGVITFVRGAFPELLHASHDHSATQHSSTQHSGAHQGSAEHLAPTAQGSRAARMGADSRARGAVPSACLLPREGDRA